jgi:hypothetical protein
MDKSQIRIGMMIVGGECPGAVTQPPVTLSQIVKDHAYNVARIEKQMEAAKEKLEAIRAKAKR